MGCDIHQKLFIWSRIENKMVPASSVLEDGCMEHMPIIVDERDYNLFGLFGNSCRSNYSELDCLESCGFPDYVSDSTVFGLAEKDGHTWRLCFLDKLGNSLLEYKERLCDPRKYREYYDDEIDWVTDAIEGRVSPVEYVGRHRDVLDSIELTIKRVDNAIKFFSQYNDVVDSGKIALLTWMDS